METLIHLGEVYLALKIIESLLALHNRFKIPCEVAHEKRMG